jgi:hypothetical protein
MVSQMKTTIELPDDLFIEAKKRAVELRVPLRVLIEEGVRARLARPRRGGPRRTRRPIRWVVVDGGLPPVVDVSDREDLHRWLREEGG